ncbi:hypothetical protein AURDEDRAFT_121166 [Auricularia subglabra TFB-10046 SS5]|nr:hypothetical protein AURDEDRAFT_121166 [Auricularia subglabra TFB-10046 SS5]
MRKLMEQVQSLALAPTDATSKLAAYLVAMKCNLAAIELVRPTLRPTGITRTSQHADEAYLWDEYQEIARFEEQVLAMRQITIIERLESEGWGAELEIYRKFILKHPFFNEPKPLFDDDWELRKGELKDAAIAEWMDAQEAKALRCAKRARYTRWVLAMRVMRDLRESEIDDGGVWPDGNDLLQMPELQTMLAGIEPDDGDVDNAPTDPKAATHVIATETACISTDNWDEYAESMDPDEPWHSDSEESFLPTSGDGTESNSDNEEIDEDSLAVQYSSISDTMTRLFPTALTAWRRRISLQLFGSIPTKYVKSLVGDLDTSSSDAKFAFLSRAATVFECQGPLVNSPWICCAAEHTQGGSRRTTAFFPAALKHRDVCALDDLNRMHHFEARTRSKTFDSQANLRVAWSPKSLRVSLEASAFVRHLVEASGMDHLTATARDMAVVDARFVCKSCVAGPGGDHASVYDWLSCFEEGLARQHHGEGTHIADFVRLTNRRSEALVRKLAPRVDDFQGVSSSLARLGLRRDSRFLYLPTYLPPPPACI